MTGPVKGRRRYDASSRQENARQTRSSILRAARSMFLDRRYAETTVVAVATAAGVSPQSVYKAFGNKAGLLKAVFDLAMAGDDAPEPMIERAALSAVRAEPDPRQKLVLYGAFVAQTAPHHVPIQLIAKEASAVDAEAATTWQSLCAERLSGMGMFARALDQEGHLAPGVTQDEARDLLWTYNSPEIYDLLVNQRGWSPDRFGSWIADSLITALLKPTGPPA